MDMGSVFKRLLDRWKIIAAKIAAFQTKVILSILYFFVMGPIAVIAYLFRSDFLKKRYSDISSFWIKEREPLNTLEGCQRQF